MNSGQVTQDKKRNIVNIYWLEAKYEFLKSLRLPVFALSTILFPTLFYMFFGLSFGQQDFGPVNSATYYFVSYGVFGVIGASLFGFGAGVAAERGQGWMRLKQASPMPPLAYFVAKLAMAAMFSTIIFLLLWLLGFLFGEVRLAALQLLSIWAIMVVGSLPFAAMGLAIGYAVGPNSAPAIVNLVYLPMAFASGLWIPIQALPEFLQKIAPFLAPYHLAQLAFSVINVDQGDSVLGHIIVLGIYTVLFLVIALILYKRDEGKTFG